MVDAIHAACERAVRAIRAHWTGEARAGIILGTGLGELAEHVKAECVISYQDIPGFPHSTALSHKSRLICGTLCGLPVVTMQGRCHLYEGYAVDRLALPVRVMRALGAELLIVSNASGGMNPNYAAGDIMILDDHINLMWCSPADGLADTDLSSGGSDSAERCRSGKLLGTSSGGAGCYDPDLVAHALAVSRREQFVAHRGVYVAVTGPTYETRAEYRLFRKIGGDVVGMSTVPEVIAARQGGMRTLAMSLVTNVAKPDAPDVVDAEEVVTAASLAAPNMQKIVESTLQQL